MSLPQLLALIHNYQSELYISTLHSPINHILNVVNKDRYLSFGAGRRFDVLTAVSSPEQTLPDKLLAAAATGSFK